MPSVDTVSGAPAPQPRAERVAYAAASALLSYPDDELLAALPDVDAALDPGQRGVLGPLLAHLRQGEPIDLQEYYVDIFDRRPSHSLHLFEHIHGESRDRGQALVDLRNEYLNHGLLPDTQELPDYIPLFLEFLGQIPPDDARALLGEAIHVMAQLGDKLAKARSPYAAVFDMLRGMTGVKPGPLPDLPEEDLEERPITFGPQGLDSPADTLARAGAMQPVTFYGRDGKPRTFSGSDAAPSR